MTTSRRSRERGRRNDYTPTVRPRAARQEGQRRLTPGYLDDLSDTAVSIGVIGDGHRKVQIYATTNGFGGSGDLAGCDLGPSGGFTHGHMVSSTALGNASAVDTAYGVGWFAEDPAAQGQWNLDGVADHARLIAYDGQVTPGTGSCSDPLNAGIV